MFKLSKTFSTPKMKDPTSAAPTCDLSMPGDSGTMNISTTE